MSSDPSPSPLVVGFPLYEDATLLDFGGATQVFAFAGGQFKPVWLSLGGPQQPIRTSEGVEVRAAYAFDDPARPRLDVVFVPGGGAGVYEPKKKKVSGVVGTMLDPAFQRFIVTASQEAQWTGSVCVGAFILAVAGLLDGCEATTYWSQLENLALFPQITVAPGFPRYVIDFQARRFTGGGVSSSIDLALELVLFFNGTTAADQAQLSIQYAPDPPVRSGDPGQAPPRVTASVVEDQLKTFIAPIRDAVKRVRKR